MTTNKKSVKKSAKKSLFTITELSTFKHQAIKCRLEGKDFFVKKDHITAIEEVDIKEEKWCVAVGILGGNGVLIKGTYQEVAAKLNWVIDS